MGLLIGFNLFYNTITQSLNPEERKTLMIQHDLLNNFIVIPTNPSSSYPHNKIGNK